MTQLFEAQNAIANQRQLIYFASAVSAGAFLGSRTASRNVPPRRGSVLAAATSDEQRLAIAAEVSDSS